nr:hypothetical protein [Tanacetum cinerariifolium]
DDYSRFSWVFFLASKDETPFVLKTFIIGLENLLSLKVKIIRCDNGTEFKNADLIQFFGLKGIKREFSVPRTPKQNGIAERKNRTLIKAARTLLADSLLLIPFWAKAVNTACYVQNRVLVTKPHIKTPYELLHGRLPRKVDEGFLVGYSVCSKAFRVFNSKTRIVQETLHVNFMEYKPNVAGSGPAWLFDIDSLSQTMNYHPVIAENQSNTHKSVSPDIHSSSSGALTRKQGDKTENKDKGKSPVVTITGFKDLNAEFEEYYNNSISTVGQNSIDSTNDFSVAGPSNADMPNLKDLSHDADDVGAEADINNLESIISVSPIPTTRIHKDYPTSKIISDLSSTTQTRSMARAVRDQVARIEAIRLFLAYASFMGFPVYQMDVKSAFLYDTIEEEVYVCQPPQFEDPENPDKVYKVVKVKQKKDGIFISQDKYVAEILRKFGLSEGKSASTPIDAEKPLLKDSDGEDVDVHTYRSMIGSLMYLTSARPDIMFTKQTDFGNDMSNPFMADNLPKIVWFSTHHITCTKSWLVQKEMALGQTATGKESSNSFMADAQVLTQGDDVQEPTAEEVVTEVAPPTLTPPSPPSPVLDTCYALARRVEGLENDKAARQLEIVKLKARVKKLEKINMVKSFKLRRLKKVWSMQKDDTEVQKAVEIVTTAKLMTEVVIAAATQAVAASTPIHVAKPKILKIADALDVSTRRRKGVVFRDPEDELPSDTPAETLRVKDKGKGILIEASKPMKKKDQIEIDAEEEMETEDQEIIKSINETPAQKAAKKRKLSEESQEAKDLRKRLEIVEDKDDNVFVEATPLAQKVPVVDYQIIVIDNKPRNQKSVHGLALVKRWKLLTSCGVHIITLSTVQLFLFIEKRYPLSRFTLEQLVNVKRLQVKEENEMSLELLRVDAVKEIKEKHQSNVDATSLRLKLFKDVAAVADANKAFRVFNSRTRIVQETLHVNFLENKPNVAGSGPAWLFDIDSLTQTLNYHPVLAENQTNSNACFQDTEKKSVSPDIHSSSCGDQTRKQDDKTENKDKGKSLVVTIIGFRDLNAEFKECNNNSSNGVNAASSLVFAAGQNYTNSTNDFSAA